MISKKSELLARREMKLFGHYSKATFNNLLKESNTKIYTFMKYLEKNAEHDKRRLKTKDNTHYRYTMDYLSHICRKKCPRNPTQTASEYLEKYLIENNHMKETFILTLNNIQNIFGCENECLLDANDMPYVDMPKCLEELSDTMLCILYNNYNLFSQFNDYLWDIIFKLENCTDGIKNNIKENFKGKDKESRTLKKIEPQLKKGLKFSWNSELQDRDTTINELLKLWRAEEIPLWYNMDVFANLNKDVWEIICMIILSDYSPNKETFSRRTEKKLNSCFV